MQYQSLSDRQRLAMLWWNQPRFMELDGIICDGSIRSGKTVAMTVGFILWAMCRFRGQTFGICGKTIESLRRNVITHLRDWVPTDLQISERRADNKLLISDGCGNTNTFYLFGGRDESSYTLVQGITLAGALLDEVALMPRSFVEQVMGRCSVQRSKLWFNCNPEGPEHWFYQEWVKEAKKQNMLRLHFTMADNLSLSDEIRTRYERMFSGVFYRRYILGEWCVANGLVYDFGEANLTEEIPDHGEYYISVDYGTLNPFSAGLWCWDGQKAVRIREYYYSGRKERRQKTDEEYYQALEALAGDLPVRRLVVDPSAASFIETIRRHGRFPVRKAENEVLPGICFTATLLKAGKVLIHRSCTDAIREFQLYCWDEKSSTDRPVKENDHAMDEIRYFCATILGRMVRGMEHGI